MKLSHKIGKLTRWEFYKRGWRRFQRKLHPIPLRPLLEKLDQPRMREIQARYASSDVQVAKYANVEQWMKTNIERVQDFGLFDDTSKLRFGGVLISLNVKAVKPA